MLMKIVRCVPRIESQGRDSIKLVTELPGPLVVAFALGLTVHLSYDRFSGLVVLHLRGQFEVTAGLPEPAQYLISHLLV